jgi:hypothetical protein
MFSSCLRWSSIYTGCSDKTEKNIDIEVVTEAETEAEAKAKAEAKADKEMMSIIHNLKDKDNDEVHMVNVQNIKSDNLHALSNKLLQYNATDDMKKLLETCYRRELDKKWTMTKGEFDNILKDLKMSSDEKEQLMSQYNKQQLSTDPPKNKDKFDSLLFLSKNNESLINYTPKSCFYPIREIYLKEIRKHLHITERMDIIPSDEYDSYFTSNIIFFDDEEHENDPKFDVLYRRINDYYFVSNNEYFQKCSDYYFKLYSNIFALVDLQKITMKYHSGESTSNETSVSLNTYVANVDGSVESSHDNTADKEITMEFEKKEGKKDWINEFTSCNSDYEQILEIKRGLPTNLQKPMYHIQSSILGLIKNYTDHNLIKFEQEQTIENTDIQKVELSLDAKFNIGSSIGLFGSQSNSRYVHQSVVYNIEFFSKNHNSSDVCKSQVGFTDRSSIAPFKGIAIGTTSRPTRTCSSDWICRVCDHKNNPLDVHNCMVCDSTKEENNIDGEGIQCSNCKYVNRADSTTCKMCDLQLTCTSTGTTSNYTHSPTGATSNYTHSPTGATSSPMSTPIGATSSPTHTYMSSMKPPSENNISQPETLPVSEPEPEPERELKWVSKSRSDIIPDNAICTGSFKTDGEVYIGRINIGPGKVNLDNGKIWNYWVQNRGSSQSGQMLVCNYKYKWINIKRGGIIPQDAVYSGKDTRNDHVWVGKSQDNEPGKITCMNNTATELKMANLWCHSAWGSYQEAYILTVIGYDKALILENLEEG